jgi:hypothetical protein
LIGIQFLYNSRALSTTNDKLFGRTSFFASIPDASSSFFFFPMVMRWHAVVMRVGAEVAVVWAMIVTMSVAF